MPYPEVLPSKFNILGSNRIGVTGYNGNLGNELVENWNCYPIDVDITDKNELQAVLDSDLFDTVINCAAYTCVDGAEDDDGYATALRVNQVGIGYLALYCDAYKKRLIHISTDYVFSGNWGPYSEIQVPYAPVNSYGNSKYGGEVAIGTFGFNDMCIVRTTGLYGGYKSDLADYIVSMLDQGKEIYITDELHANQTFVPHLAEALVWLAELYSFPEPIIHIASREVISRYEFANMLADYFGYDKSLIHPCKNSDLEWVARRPTKAGLKVNLAERYGIPIYSIQEGINNL